MNNEPREGSHDPIHDAPWVRCYTVEFIQSLCSDRLDTLGRTLRNNPQFSLKLGAGKNLGSLDVDWLERCSSYQFVVAVEVELNAPKHHTRRGCLSATERYLKWLAENDEHEGCAEKEAQHREAANDVRRLIPNRPTDMKEIERRESSRRVAPKPLLKDVSLINVYPGEPRKRSFNRLMKKFAHRSSVTVADLFEKRLEQRFDNNGARVEHNRQRFFALDNLA